MSCVKEDCSKCAADDHLECKCDCHKVSMACKLGARSLCARVGCPHTWTRKGQ